MNGLAELLPSSADGAGVIALKVVLLLLFAALGLAFAVWVALRRDPWVGSRARHPRPDPLCEAHGDIPRLDFFSASAPARNRPNAHRGAGLGATETGGRAIPSCAPAGGSGDGDPR